MKRLFVSSTFVDMNEERDALQQLVLPQINAIAKKYGDVVDCTDLRWGIDTSELESEEGSRKVLEACFSEINSCFPYMVIILGDRYGWIPNTETIAKSLEGVEGFTLDDLAKSVTNLEIEYGALQREEQKKHFFIYFRTIEGNPPDYYQSESSLHAEKLAKLKATLQQLFPDRIRRYTLRWSENKIVSEDVVAFAKIVQNDIQMAFEEEWKEQKNGTVYENAHNWQLQMMYQRARPYPGGLEWLKEYPDGEFVGILGGGVATCRTSSLCRIAVEHQRIGWRVLPVFCMQTECSLSVPDVQQYLIYHIEKLLENENIPSESAGMRKRKDLENLHERLSDLVDLYTEKASAELLIAIDDMELLDKASAEDLFYLIPRRLTPRVRIIGTVTKRSVIPGCVIREDHKSDSCAETVDFALNRFRKELSPEVRQAVINKATREGNLYITMLVQRLCMMDIDDFTSIHHKGKGMNSISEQQISLVNSSKPSFELYADILETAANQMNAPELYTAVQYLACTGKGLRERDLMYIFRQIGLQWKSLDFKRYLLYVKDFFYTDSYGRICFCSRAFLQGVANDIYQNKRWENGTQVEKELLKYIQTLPLDDCVYQSEFLRLCRQTNSPELFVSRALAQPFSGKMKEALAAELGKLTEADYGAFLKSAHRAAIDADIECEWLLFLGMLWPYMFHNMPNHSVYYGFELGPNNAARTCLLLDKLVSKETLQAHICWCKIAAVSCEEKGIPEKAEKYFEEAVSAADQYLRIPGCDLPLVAELFASVAQFGSRNRKPLDVVMDMYQRCVKIYKQLSNHSPEKYVVDFVYTYYLIGNLYRQYDKADQAIEYYDHAIRLCEQHEMTDASGQLDEYRFLLDDAIFLACLPKGYKHFTKKRTGTPLTESEQAMLKTAKHHLDQAFGDIEKQYNAAPSAYWTEIMCLAYIHYGDYYDALTGEDNLLKAIEMYENADKLIWRLIRAYDLALPAKYLEKAEWIEGRLGFLHSGLSTRQADEHLEIKYFEEATKSLEWLAEKRYLTKTQRNRRIYYTEMIAAWYHNAGGTANLKIAAERYKELLQLHKQHINNQSAQYAHYDIVRKLVMIHKRLGVESFEMAVSMIWGKEPTAIEIDMVQKAWKSPNNPFAF